MYNCVNPPTGRNRINDGWNCERPCKYHQPSRKSHRSNGKIRFWNDFRRDRYQKLRLVTPSTFVHIERDFIFSMNIASAWRKWSDSISVSRKMWFLPFDLIELVWIGLQRFRWSHFKSVLWAANDMLLLKMCASET